MKLDKELVNCLYYRAVRLYIGCNFQSFDGICLFYFLTHFLSITKVAYDNIMLVGCYISAQKFH